MEFSPLQRRLVFGLIVVVLVGLAAYLIDTAVRRAGRSATPPLRAHTSTTSPRPAVPLPTTQPVAGASPAVGAPDIYQWLPFSQAGLSAASSVALRFCSAYGTFSYTETAAAYVGPLRTLSSQTLASQIEAAFSLPGVAAARVRDRQISAGSAAIKLIRSFGPHSLTFVIQITEKQTDNTRPNVTATTYAVTLTGSASSWQVTDIELALAGNS